MSSTQQTGTLAQPYSTKSRMAKIVFYEEKNFGGGKYECNNDCADMLCYLSHCNSIKVEDGCFMVYEQPHYMGQQYFLNKGEYPEYQCWTGMTDSIGSCRIIPKTQASTFEMQLFERMEYGGQMMDLVDDCPCVMESFHTNTVFSCKVMGGNWLFYEQPFYSGRMYLIRPGEYTRFSDWGGMSARVGSIRRIVDTY